jgi:3-oxoacyl-(acyl-carrier-protein) synthase
VNDTASRCAHITGVGLITGLGGSLQETWSAVREGRSAVRVVTLSGLRVLGAPVPLDEKLDEEPNVTLARDAAAQALRDAGLCASDLDGRRTACTISSSKGGMKSLFRLHEAFRDGQGVPEDFWQRVTLDSPGVAVARDLGIRGPVVNYAAACATGVHAVIAGASMIQHDEADLVLAGAVDASLVEPLAAAFDRMGVLSHRFDDAVHACRPFDRSRDGFAIGEGAAVMVLEAEERLSEEKRAFCPRVAGTAWGADAYDLARVNTEQSAIGPLLVEALERAGQTPDEVDYINVHGTGTIANDPMESAAIRDGLGDAADVVPASSLKPYVGHCLGAAGGVELALTVLAMRDGYLPHTLNLEDPDPACSLRHVTAGGERRQVKVAVKISAGFGGHIGIVVLKRGDA